MSAETRKPTGSVQTWTNIVGGVSYPTIEQLVSRLRKTAEKAKKKQKEAVVK